MPLVCFLTHFCLTYAGGHFEMAMSETDITHKNRWMVLSHLIQAHNHELEYSLSLRIVLSCKHASTWLYSVNTSPVHFASREDGQYHIWADLFFLGSVQLQEPVRVFTYHSLWTTGGRYSSHPQLLETVLPPAAGVQDPADHFQLHHPHSVLP